jgi:hypothetical protein
MTETFRQASLRREWSPDLKSPHGNSGLHLISEPSTLSPEALRESYIILVHGLGGDWKGSWADSKTGFLWPADLIITEKLMANATVLSFGYDEKIKHTTLMSVTDIGAQLAAAITSKLASSGKVAVSNSRSLLTKSGRFYSSPRDLVV